MGSIKIDCCVDYRLCHRNVITIHDLPCFMLDRPVNGYLLVQGSGLTDKKTARTCSKLLKSSEAMWTFVRIEGVEPTNNSGERAVRHGVIYRKLSGGTKSAAGSRFVERVLTVHATLRLQGRSILRFLQAACEARVRNCAPPSLLPSTRTEPSPRFRIAA